MADALTIEQQRSLSLARARMRMEDEDAAAADESTSHGLLENLGDTAHQIGNRLYGGVLDLGGIGGDLNELGGRLENWGENKVMGLLGKRDKDVEYDPEKRWTKDILPTSGELKQFVGYEPRKPTSDLGKAVDYYGGDIIEAIPGAVGLGGGPGALVRTVAREGVKRAIPQVIKRTVRDLPSRITRGAVAPVVLGKTLKAGADVAVDRFGFPEEFSDAAEIAGNVAGAVVAHGVKRPKAQSLPNNPATRAKVGIITDAIDNAARRTRGRILMDREAVLREEFGNIAQDPALMARFSPAEQKMILNTADGRLPFERILMHAGTYRASPTGLNLRAAVPYVTGYILGLPWLGPAVSTGAKGAKIITQETAKRSAKATHAMVSEGKDIEKKLFPGKGAAVTVGVKYASQPERKTWELIDDQGNVLAVTKRRDFPGPVGVPKDLQGRKDLTWRKVYKPVREKVPLIPGGEPIVMTPSEAATAPEETPPPEEDTEDDPWAELRGDE